METVEAFSGLILVMIVLGGVLSGICFFALAKASKKERLGVWRMLGGGLAASIVTYAGTLVFSVLQFIGAVSAFLVGIILALPLIKAVFQLSLHEVKIYWIVYVPVQILAVLITAQFFLGGVKYLIQIV